MTKIIKAILLLFFVASCYGAPPKQNIVDLMCPGRGGYSENVCQISMLSLITNPEKFDNKIVYVSGYFSDGEYPLLFASKEAYEIINVPESMAISTTNLKQDLKRRLLEFGPGFIAIVGRFSIKGTLTDDVAGHRTGGTIVDLMEVMRIHSPPWGYSTVEPSLIKLKSDPP